MIGPTSADPAVHAFEGKLFQSLSKEIEVMTIVSSPEKESPLQQLGESIAALLKQANQPITPSTRAPSSGCSTPLPDGSECSTPGGAQSVPTYTADQVPSRLDAQLHQCAQKGGEFPIRGGQIGNFWATSIKDDDKLKTVSIEPK